MNVYVPPASLGPLPSGPVTFTPGINGGYTSPSGYTATPSGNVGGLIPTLQQATVSAINATASANNTAANVNVGLQTGVFAIAAVTYLIANSFLTFNQTLAISAILILAAWQYNARVSPDGGVLSALGL